MEGKPRIVGVSEASGEENVSAIENRQVTREPETIPADVNTGRSTSFLTSQSAPDYDSISCLVHVDKTNMELVLPAAGITDSPRLKDHVRNVVERKASELPTIPAPTASSGINLVSDYNNEMDETDAEVSDVNKAAKEAEKSHEVSSVDKSDSFEVIELPEGDPDNPYITHWDSDSDELCTPPIYLLPIPYNSGESGQNPGASRSPRRNRSVGKRAREDEKHYGRRKAPPRFSCRRSHFSGHRSVYPETDQQHYEPYGRKQTRKRKHSTSSHNEEGPGRKNSRVQHSTRNKDRTKFSKRVHPSNAAERGMNVDVRPRLLDYLSYLLEFTVEQISTVNTNLGTAGVHELASTMSTIIVETPEQEYLTQASCDQSVSNHRLIPRFQKLMAVVKTLPAEMVVAILEFFKTQVIPNEKLRKIQDDLLLMNVGLLMGKITLYIGRTDLRLDMLFNFLLYRPQPAYSFPFGLIFGNSFIFGYKDTRAFWDLCRKPQAVLMTIFKNPTNGDLRFAQLVVELVKLRLSIKVPDITFQMFLDNFVEHILAIPRNDAELNEYAEILAMLVVQNGTAYFEGTFTTKFEDWSKQWESGESSNKVLACFIKCFGIIAEALRRSDRPVSTEKQRKVLLAIGKLTNVPQMIRECVNESVRKLLGAAEKCEYEQRQMAGVLLAQSRPTVAQSSSRMESAHGSGESLFRKHTK